MTVMLILPIHTGILKQGDDLASILLSSIALQSGDIIVISSKAIATVEGAHIDISNIHPSDEAHGWAKKTGRSAEFMQAVIHETQRLNGHIVSHAPQTLLTDVRPHGLTTGTILTANAGLDQSNVEDGYAIGWPIDPVSSAQQLQSSLVSLTSRKSETRNSKLETNLNVSHFTNLKIDIVSDFGFRASSFAIIISDSNCRPRRLGVTAFALACCGINPLRSEIGKKDLFDHEMRVTVESTADQLATAANMLMGNAAQSTPAAIIRDHGLPMTNFCGWVDGIEPDQDLFSSMI